MSSHCCMANPFWWPVGIGLLVGCDGGLCHAARCEEHQWVKEPSPTSWTLCSYFHCCSFSCLWYICCGQLELPVGGGICIEYPHIKNGIWYQLAQKPEMRCTISYSQLYLNWMDLLSCGYAEQLSGWLCHLGYQRSLGEMMSWQWEHSRYLLALWSNALFIYIKVSNYAITCPQLQFSKYPAIFFHAWLCMLQ